MDQLLGHRTPGVGAGYGQGYPLDMLADWLSKATEAAHQRSRRLNVECQYPMALLGPKGTDAVCEISSSLVAT